MAQDFATLLASASLSDSRTVINDAMLALRSLHSGATAPASTTAYMLWADTTAGLLKIRNSADTDWLVLFKITSDPTMQESIHVVFGTSGLTTSPFFCAPFDCTINEVLVIPGTATSGSDGSNQWLANAYNATQSGVALGASNTGTNGNEFAVNTPWPVTVDQNADFDKDDVLSFTVTKQGSPTGLTNSQHVVAVRFTPRG